MTCVSITFLSFKISISKSASNKKNTLGDLFPYVLALVDRITWSLLLMGGAKYPVELVERRESWRKHHGHEKNFSISNQKPVIFYNMTSQSSLKTTLLTMH